MEFKRRLYYSTLIPSHIPPKYIKIDFTIQDNYKYDSNHGNRSGSEDGYGDNYGSG